MRRVLYLGVRGIGVRCLVLRPEATLDPARYPQGYVPLDGSEPPDTLYSLVKAGHLVAPLRKIEVIHQAYLGVRSLCRSEYPIVTAQDVIVSATRERELCGRLLIPRDFWTLDDFNDPELNQSYGVQNLYFDNFKWSQMLWRRFQLFVEEYYPAAQHTHLLYTEYMQLIKSFAAFEQGLRVRPLLPKSIVLHPPYGVTVPRRCLIEPLYLLQTWLTNFRGVLGLRSALVINAGSALVALVTRLCNVPMVRGVDPRPRAIEACRRDMLRDRRLSNISFQVAEFLPDMVDTEEEEGGGEKAAKSREGQRRYDAIVFYADEEMMSTFWGEDDTGTSVSALSSGTGFSVKLERLFDECGRHLADTGVLIVCCTNLHSILHPTQPHPIEYEVKVNRRFVVLDYVDAPVRVRGKLPWMDSSNRRPGDLLRNLRSELWVLHKTESIMHFGFMHGIPGAQPPSAQARASRRTLLQRQRVLRRHIELMGGDWGDYKARLLHMLQEKSDADEDEVAVSVRMALDPSFPAELARRARTACEANMQHEEEFHKQVACEYDGDVSPRQAFDRQHTI